MRCPTPRGGRGVPAAVLHLFVLFSCRHGTRGRHKKERPRPPLTGFDGTVGRLRLPALPRCPMSPDCDDAARSNTCVSRVPSGVSREEAAGETDKPCSTPECTLSRQACRQAKSQEPRALLSRREQCGVVEQLFGSAPCRCVVLSPWCLEFLKVRWAWASGPTPGAAAPHPAAARNHTKCGVRHAPQALEEAPYLTQISPFLFWN